MGVLVNSSQVTNWLFSSEVSVSVRFSV